jgi:2-polyprenyl-6-methoxyphenol hydroxylase-like FAD-dependent oxidoreductase
MKKTTVLISGASIAGPALAYWLDRYGFEVTVVERAPGLRPGGQAVDFKGATHMTVLERMGVLDEVRRLRTESGDGTIVNSAGRKIGTVPAAFSAGELEVPRGDLSTLLYDRTATSCEYVFDDSITALTETADGVEVTFVRSEPRTFDLVVGADGIHSNVRRLAFGPEQDYVTYLGYHYALVGLETGEAEELYGEPGRMAAVGGPKAPAFFVFASGPLDFDRHDTDEQRRLLTEAYRGAGWRVPELLARLPEADSIYLDSLSRVTIDRYAEGRVALLGDAAYGNALGGFGTGLAIVGAYVLAGELLKARGDHRTAFAAYEQKFRPYAKVSQQVSGGRILAPRTRAGMWLRNKLFSVSALFAPLMKLGNRAATDIHLEDYSHHESKTASGN